MGLSASMWTSVSGLLAHGEKMNVVGNNIANVSTIGFKSQRVDFNDYLYVSGGSTSGPTQIGAGVSTYAVIGDFSQGTLESTNSVTDLAIDGNGFFKVRQPNSDQMYYTRAGDFYFNADRQLQNPEGYYLQGWKIDNSTRLTFKSDSVNLGENSANESAFQGTGTPVDIVLDSWYLEPQRTSSISFTMGLTSDGSADRCTSATSPMTALFDQWDATKQPPIADSSYATSSSIKVYDEGGTAHTLTVYYDQVATKSNSYEIAGLPAGYTMYEYVVTIPPEEDMRSYGGQGYDPENNTWAQEPTNFYNADPEVCNKNAGMLMTGHLIFDAAGNLVNQTAYTYGANETPGDNNQCNLNPAALASWQPTRFSSNGLPVFTANFTGQPLANTVSETTTNGKSQAQDFIIELDLGLRNLGGKTGDWNGEVQSLADLELKQDDDHVRTETTTHSISPEATKLYSPDAVYLDPEDNLYKPVTAKTTSSYTNDAAGYVELNDSMAEYTIYNNPFSVVDEAPSTPSDDTTYYYVDADGAYQPAAVENDDGGFKWATGTAPTPLYIMNGNPAKADSRPVYDPAKIPGGYEAAQYKDPKTGEYLPALNADGTLVEGVPANQSIVWLTTEDVNYSYIDYNGLATFASAQRGENASTSGSSSFITQDAGQNGYPAGVLSGTNITSDGVVYGYYDNGETVPLYQIALYDFHNLQGLRREGGNLYAQTKESGEARQGVAGDNGFGAVKAYNIEGSNVDLSREFVNMITTQRGFQANSKGITTVDTMLETVIGMKR